MFQEILASKVRECTKVLKILTSLLWILIKSTYLSKLEFTVMNLLNGWIHVWGCIGNVATKKISVGYQWIEDVSVKHSRELTDNKFLITKDYSKRL
jgi:hypothetical protein